MNSPHPSPDRTNSLSVLTIRFVQLLKENSLEFIPVSGISDALNVQKRRLYDVINVLEGVNVIEKSNIHGQIHCRLKRKNFIHP
jgi:hypothetical protein